MGGIGSGRHYRHGAADCTDDYRRIDVRRWQRERLLEPGQRFNWQWSRHGKVFASIQVSTNTGTITLNYRHRSGCEEWKEKNYSVLLDWTPCAYGGQRAWFLCPAAGCGRRVAILYGAGIFACRNCYRLAYPSQRENCDDRAMRQADKIRKHLGWRPGILNGPGDKPKGMHWKTFYRLSKTHDKLAKAAMEEMMLRLRAD